MPYYDVEVLEIWAQKYRVNADNPAQAVVNYNSGRTTACIDNDMEYVELATENGMPINFIAKQLDISAEELRNQLVSADVSLDGDDPGGDGEFIPAIRDIELSDDQDD